MAGARVTAAERRLARQLALDFTQTTEPGVAAAQQIGWRAMLAALRAYRRGADPVEAAGKVLDGMAPLLASALLVAALTGIERGHKLLPVTLSLAMPISDTYKNAVQSLKQRTGLTDTAVKELEKKLQTQALRVSRTAKAAVEKKLEKTMLRITEEGLHVRDGVKELRGAFEAAGIVPGNAYMLESVYRTQTALAYAAGKVQVEQSPDAQEILWGYKYVTVGDDRVRDSHIALDGVTLPKTDPFWQENYPPNGWACRCQALPLYEQRPVVMPPDEVEINGKPVHPGADEGFRFNPGVLIEMPGATLTPI